MSEPASLRTLLTCPGYEDALNLLLSDRYSKVIEEYSLIAEDDPEYLEFHTTSVALKLQFLLKLCDLPMLNIGECMSTQGADCCLIQALKEAITRRHSGRTARIVPRDMNAPAMPLNGPMT